MGNPLVSASFGDVLDVSIRDIASGQYDLGKSRIGDFFTVKDSDRETEKYSALIPLGKLSQFNDAITYLSAEQEYDVTATHIEFAGGIQIKRKLYDDDQFGVIKEFAQQLGDSAFKTQEDDAVSFLSGAFSVASSFFSHTENVALCSNSHTTPDSSVSTTTGYDNLATSALSPTSLSAARLQMKGFKDGSGWKLGIIPDRLVVSDDGEDKASEILKSIDIPYEANNTTNVNKDRFQLYVHPRMTDSNDWFLVNTELMKKNLYWFWRVRYENARMESFDNITAKWRCYMRYSFLRRDWRWIMGSQVT
jgi:phage major head subunit gpT-like protein